MYSKIKDGDQRKKENNNPYPAFSLLFTFKPMHVPIYPPPHVHCTIVPMQVIHICIPSEQIWLMVNWLTPNYKQNFDEAHTLMSLLLEPCFSSANREREERLREGKAACLHIFWREEQFDQKGYQHMYKGFIKVIQSTKLSIVNSCVFFQIYIWNRQTQTQCFRGARNGRLQYRSHF
jgi:hypothetical protein